MDIPIIELDEKNYLGESIQYEVDDILVTITTRYNAYHDFYTIDIDCNEQALIKGHKLVTGIDLLSYFKDEDCTNPNIPNIQLIPILFNDSKETIGIEDYGSNSGIAVIRSDADVG